MKILIVGAGELGQSLAGTLCEAAHDVVVIDQSSELLERLKERLDVMTLNANGAGIDTLKTAGAEGADILIAVTNDDAINILSCQAAKHLGTSKTICRLYSTDFFSDKDGISPKQSGIDKIVIPSEECVTKIIDVLENKIVHNKILFSNPDALMTGFDVRPSCPLAGMRIKDFPDTNMLSSLRFSAVLRDRQHLIPHGDTIIVAGDKVYAAGPREKVDSMIEWLSGETPAIKRVIIAGATRVGRLLAKKLCEAGFAVRFIEKDLEKGEKLLDDQGTDMMVINGDPTEKEVMLEAGVDTCHAFVSTLESDEENILTCIMAKEQGAGKVITITNKSEYVNIVPAMEMIDCGFSSSLVAVNTILREIGTGTGSLNIDAILYRIQAFVFEFKVADKSKVCNKKLMDCKFPASTVIAMVFRDGSVLSATGDLELKAGDTVVTIATKDTIKLIEPLFVKKGLLG